MTTNVLVVTPGPLVARALHSNVLHKEAQITFW